MDAELAKVDDLTLYVFMYPVIRPANKDHSKAVWCSPDRAKAWIDLALPLRNDGTKYTWTLNYDPAAV